MKRGVDALVITEWPTPRALRSGWIGALIALSACSLDPIVGADASDVSLEVAGSLDAVDVMPDTSAVDADTGGAGNDASDGAVVPDAGIVDAGCEGPSCACCAVRCSAGELPSPIVCAGGTDASEYGFEGSTGGWVFANQSDTEIPGATSVNTTQTFAGSGSLQVAVTIPAMSVGYVRLASPASPPPHANVRFHVWLPIGVQIQGVEGYVQDQADTWTDVYVDLALGQLTPGCWNEIAVPMPGAVATPVREIGVQLVGGVTGWSGTVLVDDVSW